jgi:hypothetical protein
MMQLRLVKLPATLRGIYGTEKKLGPQQLWAHPDLEDSIAKLESAGVRLIFSDIFRSAKGSLDARRAKPGIVQPPGYSAHNYGLAIDIDHAAMMKELGISKKQLDESLAKYGLYCHRVDHELASEAWHYNCLGPNPDQWLKKGAKSTAEAIEAKIISIYGSDFTMTDTGLREALASLTINPESQAKIKAANEVQLAEHIRVFQLMWDLSVDGVAGPKTKRTLALVSATRS